MKKTTKKPSAATKRQLDNAKERRRQIAERETLRAQRDAEEQAAAPRPTTPEEAAAAAQQAKQVQAMFRNIVEGEPCVTCGKSPCAGTLACLSAEFAGAVQGVVSQPRAPEDVYGYDVTYTTQDGREESFHYKTSSERTARRRAMLRPLAREITSVRAMTERQYVSAFGRGRM